MAPLLHTDDIHEVFDGAREGYKRWKDSLPVEESDLETVLAQEERFDETLTTTLNRHRSELGEQAVKAALESVRLREIARSSTVRNRETWPAESWHRITHLMTSSELCIAGIVEYLTTGRGSRNNVDTLARWGFEHALDAYYDAGANGQDWTKLEDIPE